MNPSNLKTAIERLKEAGKLEHSCECGALEHNAAVEAAAQAALAELDATPMSPGLSAYMATVRKLSPDDLRELGGAVQIALKSPQ
jgi:hypothetical protein